MGDNRIMAKIIDTGKAERLATSFLVDRLGVDHDVAARLLGTDVAEIVAVLEGRGSRTPWARSRIEAVIATQSLLLSGYSPDAMEAWYREPSPMLDGRSPLDRMNDGDPSANGDILAAAYARIAC